jgi:hypothetical protein
MTNYYDIYWSPNPEVELGPDCWSWGTVTGTTAACGAHYVCCASLLDSRCVHLKRSCCRLDRSFCPLSLLLCRCIAVLRLRPVTARRSSTRTQLVVWDEAMPSPSLIANTVKCPAPDAALLYSASALTQHGMAQQHTAAVGWFLEMRRRSRHLFLRREGPVELPLHMLPLCCHSLITGYFHLF